MIVLDVSATSAPSHLFLAKGVLEVNVVVYEACSFKHEREQEQSPPVLQAELEREGIDAVDEMEDEEEGPHEWWDGRR